MPIPKGIKPTDPCWCGLVGVRFEDCHESRHLETPIPEGQMRALMSLARRSVNICFHPDAPAACGSVINAHSLQKAGSVKTLVDGDFNVRTFLGAKEKDVDGITVPKKVTWTKASTFNGFCNVHDGPLFAPLETIPFTGTAEQNFLVGYRAICYEMCQKLGSLEVVKVWRKYCDRGLAPAEQEDIQKRIGVYERAVRTGINELNTIKTLYDAGVSAANYASFDSKAVLFDGDVSVASTGVIQPDYDIYGMRLQNLLRLDIPAEGLAFGLVTTPTGGAYVFSWPSSYGKCERFVRLIAKRKLSEIPSYLVEFSFHYVENTYFSQAWWSSLSNEKKARIESLALTPSGYMTRPDYSKIPFTNWNISSIIP